MHPRLITHRFFDTSHWLRPGKSLAASVLASSLVWCPLRQALPARRSFIFTLAKSRAPTILKQINESGQTIRKACFLQGCCRTLDLKLPYAQDLDLEGQTSRTNLALLKSCNTSIAHRQRIQICKIHMENGRTHQTPIDHYTYQCLSGNMFAVEHLEV